MNILRYEIHEIQRLAALSYDYPNYSVEELKLLRSFKGKEVRNSPDYHKTLLVVRVSAFIIERFPGTYHRKSYKH